MRTPAEDVVITREPAGELLPIVFDSPHSGTGYPADFASILPLSELREGEDRYVDDLFALAPEHGALLIAAGFARSYIDPNRDLGDLDGEMISEPWPEELTPGEASGRGVGLIWRTLPPGRPLYDGPLTRAAIEARIATYWKRYHDALRSALDRAHARHGAAWHVNCHSMWSVGRAASPDPGRRRADFVLSDRDGRSCDPAFLECARAALTDLGHTVALNDPFKGGSIVALHGRPDEGRHSLQVEVSRALYMDEASLEPHEGFAALRADLGVFAQRLCDFVRAAPSRA